jgi:hypothetical protein
MVVLGKMVGEVDRGVRGGGGGGASGDWRRTLSLSPLVDFFLVYFLFVFYFISLEGMSLLGFLGGHGLRRLAIEMDLFWSRYLLIKVEINYNACVSLPFVIVFRIRNLVGVEKELKIQFRGWRRDCGPVMESLVIVI